MEKKDLLTSEQWQEKYKDKIIVLDPDGWDRTDFDQSWKKDKITLKEFKKRCLTSTCRFFDAKFLK